MKKIGFSGTLDPITNGHMWVINEARSIADEVVVFLSENTAKKPKFSAEERKLSAEAAPSANVVQMSLNEEDLRRIAEARAHHFGLVAELAVVVIDALDGLHARVFRADVVDSGKLKQMIAALR